jgi:SPP1 family predicted phage head-tail adaptor
MDKKYQISDFKEYVDIKYVVTTPDTAGGTKPGYASYISSFAKVEPYDGDLFIEGGERIINNKFAFIFRYRAAVAEMNKGYKIDYRGNSYIIHSIIDENSDKRYVKVIAYRRK